MRRKLLITERVKKNMRTYKGQRRHMAKYNKWWIKWSN